MKIKAHVGLQVAEVVNLDKEIVQLARVALGGNDRDATQLIRRIARRQRKHHPAIADELIELLRSSPTRSSPLRKAASPLPIDSDSRLMLLKSAATPIAKRPPVLNEQSFSVLRQLLEERQQAELLHSHGLSPTRTALLVGPPGVGKTLSVTWLAEQLSLPLLTLDLSAVMNSLLGKTGSNLRVVLDHARGQDCVLFLDEIDAVAKRRDDVSEVGELTRLVTVLLQEIDDWPTSTLLVAATNHPELLDPAVWRRFEVVLELELPGHDDRRSFAEQLTSDGEIAGVVAASTEGWSYADIEKELLHAERRSILRGTSAAEEILHGLTERIATLDRSTRTTIGLALVDAGTSQRSAASITGVSRDTLRSHKARTG